jgi:hypothetical protein
MEGSSMIKIRNLSVIMTILLALAFTGCGGGGSSSDGDDGNPTPDQIYSATGNWTVDAVSQDQNNQCSMILGPSYQATITIAESNGTVTITYTEYGITVSGTRQGNTLTYNGPVYYNTEQIGTVNGTFNITSDSTLVGTMTVNGSYQAMTCQATYDLTGNKNP